MSFGTGRTKSMISKRRFKSMAGLRRLGFYCLGVKPHSACGFGVERVERSLSPHVHSFDGGHAALAVDYFDFKHHLYVLCCPIPGLLG